MRKLSIILLITALCMFPAVGFALTIKFEWNRNAEPDMDHYVMYRCPDNVNCGSGTSRVAVGTIPHPSSGEKVTWSYVFTPPSNTEEIFYFACTAVDQSQNESGPSNIVSTRVDNKPPGAPTGPLKILGVLP